MMEECPFYERKRVFEKIFFGRQPPIGFSSNYFFYFFNPPGFATAESVSKNQCLRWSGFKKLLEEKKFGATFCFSTRLFKGFASRPQNASFWTSTPPQIFVKLIFLPFQPPLLCPRLNPSRKINALHRWSGFKKLVEEKIH